LKKRNAKIYGESALKLTAPLDASPPLLTEPFDADVLVQADLPPKPVRPVDELVTAPLTEQLPEPVTLAVEPPLAEKLHVLAFAT
jgi:hypothetical protein